MLFINFVTGLINNKWFRLAIFGLCALIILGGGIWIADVARHLIQLRQEVQIIQEMVGKGFQNTSLDTVKKTVSEANNNLENIQKDIRPIYPLLDFISIFPGAGSYVGQVHPILDYATEMTRAVMLLYQVVEPIWIEPGLKGYPLTQRMMISIEQQKKDLDNALSALINADDLRKKINPNLLPGKYREEYLKFDSNFDLIYYSVSLFEMLPEIMGENNAKTYLLLAQNNNELRGTGGFISAIGTAKLDMGIIAQFNMADSYTVDDYSKKYPKAPEPLEKYMLAGYWVPRDANWSPDFPTTAVQVQSLYELSTNQKTDGVFAIDQRGIKLLVDALGPLTIEDYPEQITADNVEDYMQIAWSPTPPEGVTDKWWQNRKNFIKLLGDKMVTAMTTINAPDKMVKLGQNIMEAVRGGHLLIYFNDPLEENLLSQAELDGGVSPGADDFLMLVDSNIGFNKVDAVINRSLDYYVDLSNPANPKASVRLFYQHTGNEAVNCVHQPQYGNTYKDMEIRCYWDYWRTLVNHDTQLVDAQTEKVPGEWLLSGQDWDGKVREADGENGTRSFEGLLVLPVGMNQEVVLDFALPSTVVKTTGTEITYSLRVQKQSGLESLPFVLYIVPPNGYVLIDAAGWKADKNLWIWEGNLTHDYQNFDLVFIQSGFKR